MESKKYNNTLQRFEEVAISFGITNFNKDRRNKYTDVTTAKFFKIYLIGKSDAKLAHNSHFILGRVVRNEHSSKIQFSDNPTRHASRTDCQTELDRLSKKYVGETFLMYQCVRARTVEVDSVDDKPHSPAISSVVPTVRKHFPYADNGFGDLIKVSKEAQMQATFSFFRRDMDSRA